LGDGVVVGYGWGDVGVGVGDVFVDAVGESGGAGG
jgi:hypothetical protein